MNLNISIEYIKSLKTIGELQEVYRVVGNKECTRIEGGITNTPPIGTKLHLFFSSPSAQDILDGIEVEYTQQEQADINLTKCCRRMKWNTMQN